MAMTPNLVTTSSPAAGRTRRQTPHTRRRASAFTLVELLLALVISTALVSAIAVALDASFRAYATTAESANTDVAGRQVMQRVLALIRAGRVHDAYDPNNANLTLAAPSQPPVQSVGIQMLSRDDALIRIWWAANDTYGQDGVGDLWFQLGTNAAQLFLTRVEAQQNPTTELYYVFTLGSRMSDDGLLLMLANFDITAHPEPASAMSAERRGATAPIRLVGSTRPRKNIE